MRLMVDVSLTSLPVTTVSRGRRAASPTPSNMLATSKHETTVQGLAPLARKKIRITPSIYADPRSRGLTIEPNLCQSANRASLTRNGCGISAESALLIDLRYYPIVPSPGAPNDLQVITPRQARLAEKQSRMGRAATCASRGALKRIDQASPPLFGINRQVNPMIYRQLQSDSISEAQPRLCGPFGPCQFSRHGLNAH